MIKRKDFQIEVGCATSGATFVRVVHLATGLERRSGDIPNGEVGRVRDRLLRELNAELYDENDFLINLFRSEPGDCWQLVHLPSGKSRSIATVGCQNQHELIRDAIDSILEELAGGGVGRETGSQKLDNDEESLP
jgi:hypothetical protein